MEWQAIVETTEMQTFRDLVSDTFLRLEFRSPQTSLVRSRFRAKQLGDVCMTRAHATLSGGALAGRRNVSQIRQDDNRYFVLMVNRMGRIVHQHQGRTTETGPGSILMLNSAAPYEFVQHGNAASLNIRVPSAPLRALVGSPESYCGRVIPVNRGLNATYARFLEALYQEACLDLAAGDHEAMEQVALETIASLCRSIGHEASSIVTERKNGLYDRIIRIINSYLDRPNLTPRSIADSAGVSIGHLHAVVRDNGTTVCTLIRKKRLEKCRHDLIDDSLSERSVSNIAYEWGFNDSAHFARCFRAEYGMSPTEYRRSRPS